MPALVYEKKGRIAYITLNRPEVLNAMNSEIWGALVKAWIDVRDDPDVWVALVTGAGDKAFCAGQDLKELGAWLMTPHGQRSAPPIPDISPMRGMQVWKPFIAAINGICTGGGLELAMACDIRIAADTARVGLRHWGYLRGAACKESPASPEASILRIGFAGKAKPCISSKGR